MKTLRLITTYKCNRNCKGCCNKQSNFVKDNVPEITEPDLHNLVKQFTSEDEIIITGGEPMLHPRQIWELIDILKFSTKAKFILYTARLRYPNKLSFSFLESTLSILDGLTVTLHDREDVEDFYDLDRDLKDWYLNHTISLRLNVFKEVGEVEPIYCDWQIKDNIVWLDNCPLPKNEILFKLNPLL